MIKKLRWVGVVVFALLLIVPSCKVDTPAASKTTSAPTTVTVTTTLTPSSVNIGAISQVIGGLDVAFLANGLELVSPATTVQLAVKITNQNAATISNVDIVGTITFSVGCLGTPTLTPEDDLLYTTSFQAPDVIHFETYLTSTSKTISTSAGMSFTLRPQISVLGSPSGWASTITMSIASISYNGGQ
jgi:hypothetical protein